GGLRDLHLLRFLVAPGPLRPRDEPSRALASAGLPQTPEAARARAGARFMALVREAVQRRSRDPSNVLVADLQEPVAVSLGLPAAGGSLSRLLPEWEGVRGRPQRDPYHRDPVDVHLIRTAAEAARLLREPDEPFVREAVKVLDDPASLLLGALLHDIGKVGRGSHVPQGVAIAERALDRWGVTGHRRADVLFLVRDHLLLSDTATRRNLEDED